MNSCGSDGEYGHGRKLETFNGISELDFMWGGKKKKKEKRKKEKKQAVAVSHLGGSLTVCCAGVPEPSQSATGNKIQCNRYVNFLTVEVSNCV